MWDEDVEGTEEDYSYQASLVSELVKRAHRLLNISNKIVPDTYNPGVLRQARVGPVVVKNNRSNIILIEVCVESGGSIRAYTEIGRVPNFINRKLVTEIVLPTLRQAMILDDIADAGDSDE